MNGGGFALRRTSCRDVPCTCMNGPSRSLANCDLNVASILVETPRGAAVAQSQVAQSQRSCRQAAHGLRQAVLSVVANAFHAAAVMHRR